MPYQTHTGIHFRHELGKDLHAPGRRAGRRLPLVRTSDVVPLRGNLSAVLGACGGDTVAEAPLDSFGPPPSVPKGALGEQLAADLEVLSSGLETYTLPIARRCAGTGGPEMRGRRGSPFRGLTAT